MFLPLGSDAPLYYRPLATIGLIVANAVTFWLTAAGTQYDGWILRHYGFLGASWPHLEPYVLEPGESVTLRYRVLVFRGDAARAGVAQAHAAYVSASE